MPEDAKIPIFGDVTLFQNPPAHTPAELSIAQETRAGFLKLSSLLPIPNIELTRDEQQRVSQYQEARLILGSAGSAPMVCAGFDCPFASRCPLVQINKAPVKQICPFESHYVIERFHSWMSELGRTIDTLTESERVTIANLVYLDLQEQRCNQALSEAKNALMATRTVRDVDINTGQPVCWEDIIHINAQRLDSIIISRRMLMKDFELTPEQKTKRLKWLGQKDGLDFASRMADKGDKLRRALRRETVVEVKPSPAPNP